MSKLTAYAISARAWAGGQLSAATRRPKIGGSLRGRARLAGVPASRSPAPPARPSSPRPTKTPTRFSLRPRTPARLSSPAAKPPPSAPPKEFAYDVVTRPGETLTFRAAP